MQILKRLVLLLLISATALSGALDSMASGLAVYPFNTNTTFSARALFVLPMTGTFTDYEGTFTFNPATNEINGVEVIIQTASIKTIHEDYDEIMRGSDFLMTDTHPTARFVTNAITPIAPQLWKIDGQLTIRGITQPITMQAEQTFDCGKDLCLEIAGKASRSAWGMVAWPLVSDTVSFKISGAYSLL